MLYPLNVIYWSRGKEKGYKMDIEQLWEKAQEKTEVVRGRVKSLPTFRTTKVPYIFLGESSVNPGNTVVRKGKVIIEKPLILLPEDLPQFDGFNIEEELEIEQGAMQMFFMMRGIRFPSLKYNNSIEKLDLEERSLAKTAEKYKRQLERQENVNVALILGPEECWQFSILIYMAALVGRCARNDIMNLMDKFRGL
ncbi:MAG: hypothetical protein PHH49_07210 [Candidatus Omnitrophica bacterium]|nr:hypothetical protein [Candidatus Omnitrophota bacterium]MDD5488726.1 hypothetical protein [Candidatus Omnitrophota bacterium]